MPRNNEPERVKADIGAQEITQNEIVEDENSIRLSVEDQVRFAELLLNPPELSPALLRASETHKRLIRDSR